MNMVCLSICLGLLDFFHSTFYSFQHINTYVLLTLHLIFFSDYVNIFKIFWISH